jgi:branched-subunit amino acid ABC-type transport system permease component
VIERTKLGAYLRAGTENPTLVQAFGINVPRMITLTYGFGVGAGGACAACWPRRSTRSARRWAPT